MRVDRRQGGNPPHSCKPLDGCSACQQIIALRKLFLCASRFVQVPLRKCSAQAALGKLPCDSARTALCKLLRASCSSARCKLLCARALRKVFCDIPAGARIVLRVLLSFCKRFSNRSCGNALRVLLSYLKVTPHSHGTTARALRHARSSQRVRQEKCNKQPLDIDHADACKGSRGHVKVAERLSFVTSATPIPTEGSAGMSSISSPQLFDTEG